MTDMPTPTLDDLAGQVAQALDLTTQRVNALFAHSGSGRMPSDESKRNLTAGVLSALCTAARLGGDVVRRHRPRKAPAPAGDRHHEQGADDERG